MKSLPYSIAQGVWSLMLSRSGAASGEIFPAWLRLKKQTIFKEE